jgi:hypothetical protein
MFLFLMLQRFATCRHLALTDPNCFKVALI